MKGPVSEPAAGEGFRRVAIPDGAHVADKRPKGTKKGCRGLYVDPPEESVKHATLDPVPGEGRGAGVCCGGGTVLARSSRISNG